MITMELGQLNTFARIGKGVISKVIGLQENHKEVILNAPDKLNEVKSGCYFCPYYQEKQEKLALGLSDVDAPCKGCHQAVWEHSYTVTYVNEKNRYGYQPTLKSYAIKLLLLYHFLQPDPMGLIKNVCIKDLSETLGCTVQTIHNCNKSLVEYGYCYIGNTGWDDGYINVWLAEYKNYHLGAHEGGRGYLTMPSSMFWDILSIKTLNPLRLTLKGLLEVDNHSNLDIDVNVKISYKKLRYFLPDYCNRNTIKKALEQDNPVFTISLDQNNVTYKLPTKLSPKCLRKEAADLGMKDIKDYVSRLNDLFDSYPQETDYSVDDFHEILNTLFIEPSDTYQSIIISDKAYHDLGSMCAQYSATLVRRAIATIYNSFINKGRVVHNIAALVRTTIRNMAIFKIAS